MTLRIGVLGAGYFAAFHHEAWGRVPGARLAAVADRDAAAAGRAAAACGARPFGALADMLDAGLDVLDICVPPSGHAEAIRAGLGAGLRAIVCQKPFCASPVEARAAAAQAEAAGVPLVVHENFRFQPWWRAIRAALEAGHVGEPYSATFRLRTGDGQGPDAYMARQPYFQAMPRLLIHETGVHYIDVFRYLLGDPSSVWADLRRLNPAIAGEDAGLVVMEHGRARSLFDGNRLADHAASDPRRTFGEGLVEGAEGALTLTGDGEVRLRRRGEAEGRVLLEGRARPGFAGDCVRALQAHVAAHLTEGAPLENRARDYLGVLAAEEAAYLSHEEGRRVAL